MNTLSSFAIQRPDDFCAWCDKLRAAGVVKLGALVLGPKPRSASDVEKDADPDAAAKRAHDIMFASSRIKPPFVPRQNNEAGYPNAIRERLARTDANGTPKPQR